MEKQSFDQLIDQAAAGLKSDRELYLDVKQELHCHLEEKAEHFAREGHSEDESVDLAKKSFGSPLDMAAELLDANRKRMKLRSLIRLAFGALIVPLSIIMALYVGYGRFVRLQGMASMFSGSRHSVKLPTLPFYGHDWATPEKRPKTVRQLSGGQKNADNIRRYWETHRQDPNSRMYYAYYAIFLEAKDEKSYVEAMRRGEQIEPQNALYNVQIAKYYLDRGMLAKLEKTKNDPKANMDDLLDRRTFELGVKELQAAARKPYLHTYQMNILAKRLNSMPRPLFTEDYLSRIAVAAAEMFPQLAGYRNLARKVPGCARILITEGRTEEAKAVMDTWKPYTKLLLSDQGNTFIHQLVTSAVGEILTKEASSVYDQLGEHARAQETRIIYDRLTKAKEDWRKGASSKETIQFGKIVKQHGTMVQSIFFPVFGGNSKITEQELAPGRMHEYVLVEEMFVQVMLLVLMLALIGTLMQGAIWLHKLRRASAVPILLMLPVKEILRALLLGIVLPFTIYWIYSRLPLVAGREFSLRGGMMHRFIAEMCILGIVMLWIPTGMIRRYIRKRCADLGIELPTARDETKIGWFVPGGIVAALVIFASSMLITTITSPVAMIVGTILAVLVILGAVRYAIIKRGEHGLYYGTLAKSLAPVYAISIFFISLTVQPWLLYNEAKLLPQDTLIFGYLANAKGRSIGFTAIEEEAAHRYSETISKALDSTGK